MSETQSLTSVAWSYSLAILAEYYRDYAAGH